MKHIVLCALLLVGTLANNDLRAQITLPAGSYIQNFDSIAGGLPAGWSLYTGATATASGTVAAFSGTQVSWGSTTGGFRNVASAAGLSATSTTTEQGASTNRAPGIRQTGTFGDPGASFDFNYATTGLQIDSIALDALMLSEQGYSTVWLVQYALGATPASWSTFTGGTYTDPGVWGSSTLNLGGFGTALDNQANVWVRVVALSAATGSGSRDTFGIDNVSISTSVAAVPEPSTWSLLFIGLAGMTVLRWNRLSRIFKKNAG